MMGRVQLVSAFFAFFAGLPLGAAQADNLGLAHGYTTLHTTNFDIQLVKDAQVLASLKPAGQSFDFLPYDYLSFRAGNGQYHWGDITYRYRAVGATAWTTGDSSAVRKAVTSVTTSGSLAAANLKPTLPSGAALNVTREWINVNGDLGLQFTITNQGTAAVEVGSLGFPAEFNSIFTNRTAEQIQAKCSLSDPYIGLHGGYIRVSPVSGNGAALVVTPIGDTPLEAYRNLDEPYYDATQYESQVFEGFYEWQVYSKAWAENEWKSAQPWSTPSSRTLQPGESYKAGLRFSLAKSGIRAIDDAVQGTGTPYVRGIPGFIIPQDLPAQLIVKPGSGGSVTSIASDPAGVLTASQVSSGVYSVTPSTSAFGRVRLTITYSSGIRQTVHYFITKTGPATVSALGNFLTTTQYYTDTSDPFGRAPSVLSYDYIAGALVLQDPRVWIAGLSDEAGAGSFLAACMKQSIHPDATEITKLEAFVSSVMWGRIQTTNYAVRKSIFFYEPAQVPGYKYSSSIDWGNWWSWDKADAYATDRAYDYVHVAASYWGLYRAARAYPTLFKQHDWSWYLNQAYNTVLAATATGSGGNYVVGYADDGLMGETVFGQILADLKREGLTSQASTFEARMKTRATRWNSEAVPFGSEMAWDSTGQEGIYYWSKYFGYTSTATKALNTVLGFQPTVAHWGWNGNARRYWDNIYGGKLQRIERQIHHYGSGLNALVALSAFRSSPTDNYLLRVGYGGMNGPMSNINSAGFAAASFHSWPSTLAWDGYSGDYGPNFVGLALGAASYLVADPDLGTVAYGGVLSTASDGTLTLVPKDVARRRVYVGALGVLAELDSAAISKVTYKPSSKTFSITVAQLDGVPKAASAILWLQTESGTTNYTVTTSGLSTARSGWQIPLSQDSVTVTVAALS